MKILAPLLLAWVITAEFRLAPAPLGLDSFVPAPAANPLTSEKVALGRKLFFDKRLSHDGTLSCATCHDPKRSFADSLALARGLGNVDGTRNSPALINAGYGAKFFWDGRAPSLEQLAIEPILNPKELGSTEVELERRTGMRSADVAAALATYVRTIRSGDSRFDRYTAGQSGALNALEKKGLAIFRGGGGCAACHIGPLFTDERFHNTGIAWRDGRISDEGRFAVSKIERDRGAFKTPTLRDLTRTAPYMHDGSLATLEEVLDFYSDGGRKNPNLDRLMEPRTFTAEEKLALLSFLKTLTGRVSEGLR